jgi:hypothetical protein
LENELVWELGPGYADVVRREKKIESVINSKTVVSFEYHDYSIDGFDIDNHDLENPRFHS